MQDSTATNFAMGDSATNQNATSTISEAQITGCAHRPRCLFLSLLLTVPSGPSPPLAATSSFPADKFLCGHTDIPGNLPEQ
jgi:hypothetical protein